MPNFKIENSLKKPVIGVDEVGRGPLAGPVVSCACVFFEHDLKMSKFKLINDSKKLSLKKRNASYNFILDLKKKNKLNFKIGLATVEEIDKFNILNATILSMERAIKKLKYKNGSIIVDGNIRLSIGKLFCKDIIKGDQISLSIATASIIAKIYRDNYMIKIGKNYPYFQWDKNAGYGTKEHTLQIKHRGITKHHRKSFEPIKSFIQNKIAIC